MEDDAKVFSKKEKKIKHYDPLEEMESMKNSKKKKKKLNEHEEPPTIYSKTKKMKDVDSDGKIEHILVYFKFYSSVVLNLGIEIQIIDFKTCQFMKENNLWLFLHLSVCLSEKKF